MKSNTENIQDYYGKVLSSKEDLQTTACCTAESMPSYLKPIMSKIHTEVLDKFYGCGSPIPFVLEGKTVLDLGSGTGRDVFIASKLVGPEGRVIGVDMTKEQIKVAESHIEYHQKQFELSAPNVEFKYGFMEDLKALGIEDNSVDVVISNCVLNLADNKEQVFKEIFRVLKPGGELYFSDVFSSRRIPEHLAKDPVLLGECLGGALYTEDFRRILNSLGVDDYRVVNERKLDLLSKQIEQQLKDIDFYSITVRAFKVSLEDRPEDYGQQATYIGGIKESPESFMLDENYTFNRDKPKPVCGNTANILQQTRFKNYFKIQGDQSAHKGLFKPPASKASCC